MTILSDMSREMLDILEKRQVDGKRLYQNVHCSLVGGGNRIETIGDNVYDAVVISGGYAQSHMPVDSLLEIHRVIKPGGVFINNMTEYYQESVEDLRQLEPFMKQMERDGKWKMLSRETEPNMLGGKTGCFHTFRKAVA